MEQNSFIRQMVGIMYLIINIHYLHPYQFIFVFPFQILMAKTIHTIMLNSHLLGLQQLIKNKLT